MSINRRIDRLEETAGTSKSDGPDFFVIDGEKVPLSDLTRERIHSLPDEQLSEIANLEFCVRGRVMRWIDLTDKQLRRIPDGEPLEAVVQ